MKKPTIAMVADYNCIRVTKEATALRNLGYNLIIITAHPRNIDPFNTLCICNSTSMFEATIASIRADIWYVHSDPTCHAQIVRSIHPKAKIIIDVHDSNYWFYGDQIVDGTDEKIRWYEEDVGIACADGFVVPSIGCKKDFKKRTDKPIIDLPPAVPYEWYHTGVHGFAGGLVCQGGIGIGSKHKNDLWRDYSRIFRQLKGKREVSVYSPVFDGSNPVIEDYYKATDAKIGRLDYDKLIKKLGDYSWNLVGNIEDHKIFDVNLQNKLFDGIAAGIPSVVFKSKCSADVVLKNDIGIVCESVDELLERWDEHIEKRKNLWLCRKDLSMENYIGRLTGLYEEVLNG